MASYKKPSKEDSYETSKPYPTKEYIDTPEWKKIPDPKLHKVLSFVKSGIRIIGYVLLPFDPLTAVAVLIFSEVVGIVEETV